MGSVDKENIRCNESFKLSFKTYPGVMYDCIKLVFKMNEDLNHL